MTDSLFAWWLGYPAGLAPGVVQGREIPSADPAARPRVARRDQPRTAGPRCSPSPHCGAAKAHAAMLLVANQVGGVARVQTPLTIAGMFAYLDGRGAEAGIAFDAARDTAETHSPTDRWGCRRGVGCASVNPQTRSGAHQGREFRAAAARSVRYTDRTAEPAGPILGGCSTSSPTTSSR